MKARAPKSEQRQPVVQQPESGGLVGQLGDQNSLGNAEIAARLSGQGSEVESPTPAASKQVAELKASRPAGSAVDAATRDQLINRLKQTPDSKQLLDDIKKIRGDLNISMTWSDRGSYHRTGSISLDNGKTLDELHATMAHELVHLHTYLSGKTGSIRRDGRDQYVRKMMDDEVKAQTMAYVSLLQGGITSNASSAGFNEFVDLLRNKHSDVLGPEFGGRKKGFSFASLFGSNDEEESAEETDWEKIKELAHDFLDAKFKNAEWKTSNTGESYYDYYGAAWDKAHP